MKLLLDTQVLLWAGSGGEQMPKAAYRLVKDEKNELYFSVVSLWETAIKFALGRRDFQIVPRQLREGLLERGYRELPVLGEHVCAVASLPPLHGDPFDRLLVVQAEIEGMVFVTADRELPKYGRHVLLV